LLQQLQQQQRQLVSVLISASKRAQQLADDLQQLQQLLIDMQNNGVLQQLNSFLDSVAAQLPVHEMCNNPACTNLQHSEMVLVRGKSTRCSRCKEAR
jgi:flagellar hook-associated protein FlgK